MKLNSCLITKLLITISLICIATSIKKENSMMEYMNNMFSSDTKAQILFTKESNSNNNIDKSNSMELSVGGNSRNLHKKKKNHRVKTRSAKNRNFRFKESLGLLANSTNSTNKTVELIKEGWLMISSPSFRNRQRFPPVALPNGSFSEIEVNSEMYRKNRVNCNSTEAPDCNLKFWFRIAPELHLYYASSKSDLNILGVLSIQKVLKIGDPDSPIWTKCGETYCFEIEDTVDSKWKLCASTWQLAMRWICSIKKELNVDDPTCNPPSDKEIQIVEKTIKEPIIIIPLPSRHCNDGWNYQKNGDDWECDCKEGAEQSPIDLPQTEQSIDSPVKPLFSYNEIQPRSTIDTIDREMKIDQNIKLKIFKNAFRIFHHNFGKVTTIDGAVYHAEEIVIHTPAEHTIDGKTYDMEVQIIHYGQTKGDISKQIILSFLVEKKAGVYNQFFDDLDIFNLPNALHKERDILNSLFIPKLFYKSDNEHEIPTMKPFSFYTYQGSLTSPPCSERTIMYVVSKPIQLSTTVIQLFKEALRIPDLMDHKGNVIVSDYLPQSNRKIQDRRGRPVFFYDHVKYCGPDPVLPKPKPVGHYEKVAQKSTNYFYVNGDKPSGLPGAFVVSEKEAKGLNMENVGGQ